MKYNTDYRTKNKKNIINGEFSTDTKIVVGDIDEEDIDGMKVFKLKKMVISPFPKENKNVIKIRKKKL